MKKIRKKGIKRLLSAAVVSALVVAALGYTFVSSAANTITLASSGRFEYDADGNGEISGAAGDVILDADDLVALKDAVTGLNSSLTAISTKAYGADGVPNYTGQLKDASGNLISGDPDDLESKYYSYQTSHSYTNTQYGDYGTSQYTKGKNDALANLSNNGEAWTTAGTYKWTVPSGVTSITVLYIRGGGGGGGGGSGGGGGQYYSGIGNHLNANGGNGASGSSGGTTKIKNLSASGGRGGGGGRAGNVFAGGNYNFSDSESMLASDIPTGSNGGKGGDGGRGITGGNEYGTYTANGWPGSYGEEGALKTNQKISVSPGETLTIVVGAGGDGGAGGYGGNQGQSSPYVAGGPGGNGSAGSPGFVFICW